MALTFNTSIEMASGIVLDNAYGRVAVADNVTGETLQQLVEIYASEAAFLAGKQPVETGIMTTMQSAYNRATDGSDVLAIAHANLKALLADQGFDTTIVL